MSGELNDVVIVGAGAMGCAVAYYLGKEGIGSTIVERDGVAAHASGYSAGGLNPLEGTGIPGPLGSAGDQVVQDAQGDLVGAGGAVEDRLRSEGGLVDQGRVR